MIGEQILVLVNFFRRKRFKGMIYPDMGATYEDARRISERKSIWMVEYLRARRPSDGYSKPLSVRNTVAISYYRKQHFFVDS